MKDCYSILAADIGGTHARLGLVSATTSENASTAAFSLESYTKYKCRDFSSIENIFSDFASKQQTNDIDAVTLACAGYFEGDLLRATNLPWEISLNSLRDTLNISSVFGLNDYEALASGTFGINGDSILGLNPKGVPMPSQARLVLGPGTGLGAAVSLPNGSASVTLTTESGNAAFAPMCKRDEAIRDVLLRIYDFVSIEHLLSGPGLVNIYRALAAVTGQSAELKRPSEISSAALNSSSELAVASLNAFCEILGSVSGDFALMYGARGGVYLAGGILPKFSSFLAESKFLERFLSKGEMRSYLERIPVHLINHGSLGVIGAASWYVNNQR